MSDHDRDRELAAAYVLGALEPDERVEYERHLATCGQCRGEVLVFAPLPGLLQRVSLDELSTASPDPQSVQAAAAAVRSEVVATMVSRDRWRTAAIVASVILVLTATVAALTVGLTGGEEEPREHAVVLDIETASASGDVVARPEPWGTYLHLSLAGLPRRDRYLLWVIDQAGLWHPAGSWGPSEQSPVELGGSTQLDLDDIDRIVVTSDDRDDQLLTAR